MRTLSSVDDRRTQNLFDLCREKLSVHNMVEIAGCFDNLRLVSELNRLSGAEDVDFVLNSLDHLRDTNHA
jgi:hypothetical protein